MTARSDLLLPPPSLTSCLAVGISRDTLGADLSDRDRMNYFPASPVYSVTRVFDGAVRMANSVTGLETLRSAPALPPLSASIPLDTPVCSWSPAGLRAITIGIYPDAWMALGGSADAADLPSVIKEAMGAECSDITAYWARFSATIAPVWNVVRPDYVRQSSLPITHRLADWSRHIVTAAAFSGAGRSLRSVERRLRRWTGQSQQSLEFFARIEDLYQHSLAHSDAPLAQIAVDADFSDQSHMGRAVKRATGFTPAEINRRIATDEAFWCYRLLGERF